MRPEPDVPGDFTPSESEIPRTNPDLPISDQSQGTKPYRGGYYWLPTPSPDGITWSVVSCRDLDCGTDAGHDADLWPRLMVPLAVAWGTDSQILKKRLALSYTGLPRGRVTRPDKTFLVLHGQDSPAAGWEEMVIESFRLSGRKVKFVYDEHETQLPGHHRTLAASLGLRSYQAGD
jgi:hypothetical protein